MMDPTLGNLPVDGRMCYSSSFQFETDTKTDAGIVLVIKEKLWNHVQSTDVQLSVT